MNLITVMLYRFAELLESKMGTAKAAKQVADEMAAFENYCSKNKIYPKNVTTDNIRLCKYK